MWSKCFVFVMFFIFCFTCLGQQERIKDLREISAVQDEKYDPSIMSGEEDLDYYLQHKIDINKEFTILEDLGILSSIQRNELQKHISKCGALLSIYELQTLEYWSLEDIRSIMPFVKVEYNFENRNLSFKDVLAHSNKVVFYRASRGLETKSGYLPSQNGIKAYSGNSWQNYLRFRMNYSSNFSLGFTLEKDAGENFLNAGVPDFLSAHCFIGNRGKVKSFVLGDYSLILGQGLIHGTGFSSGKSLQITSVKQRGQGIKPYTSVNESAFLRGSAFALEFSQLQVLAFVSHKKVDANLTASKDSILSLPIHGFHRTESEKENNSKAKESLFGVKMGTNLNGFRFSGQYVLQKYNLPYFKSLNYYNGNHFRGKVQQNTSVNYDYNVQNLNVFGEIALDINSSSFAQLHGVLLALNKYTSISTLYRKYSSKFNSFYGSGFSESTRIQNEEGFYFSMDFKKGRHNFKMMADIFRFPGLKYKLKAPSKGREIMAHYQFNTSKKNFIYFRLRYKEKDESIDVEKPISQLVSRVQLNTRAHIQIQMSSNISWRSRIEFSNVKLGQDQMKGSIWYHDIIYRSKHVPLDISLRYAIFDTESYDARIYAYENNVLYMFSIPAYFYKGSRVYCVLRWKLNKRFDIWIKLAQSIYTDRKSISQGNEEIQGNKKTDLTLQMRLKL